MNENYVSAIGWLSWFVHMRQHVSVRVRSLGWVCGVHERSVRVRCDRNSHAQVYLLLILKTLGKLGKNVAKYGTSRPRPKQDTSTYILGVLVLKKKGGVFLRRI